MILVVCYFSTSQVISFHVIFAKILVTRELEINVSPVQLYL